MRPPFLRGRFRFAGRGGPSWLEQSNFEELAQWWTERRSHLIEAEWGVLRRVDFEVFCLVGTGRGPNLSSQVSAAPEVWAGEGHLDV